MGLKKVTDHSREGSLVLENKNFLLVCFSEKNAPLAWLPSKDASASFFAHSMGNAADCDVEIFFYFGLDCRISVPVAKSEPAVDLIPFRSKKVVEFFL